MGAVDTPPEVFTMRMLIICAIVLTIVSIFVLLVLRPESDGLDHYPHPYISEYGYDRDAITVIHAPFHAPPEPPLGSGFAWQCDDPTFNDDQGRPWLFPVPLTDNSQPMQPPQPPSHPVLRRRPDPATCRPYRTSEGEQLLADYRVRMGH